MGGTSALISSNSHNFELYNDSWKRWFSFRGPQTANWPVTHGILQQIMWHFRCLGWQKIKKHRSNRWNLPPPWSFDFYYRHLSHVWNICLDSTWRLKCFWHVWGIFNYVHANRYVHIVRALHDLGCSPVDYVFVFFVLMSAHGLVESPASSFCSWILSYLFGQGVSLNFTVFECFWDGISHQLDGMVVWAENHWQAYVCECKQIGMEPAIASLKYNMHCRNCIYSRNCSWDKWEIDPDNI